MVLPLRLLGALWFATMAGFFWSFSFVVMPGLARTDAAAGMAAMQAINLAVRNAVFGLGFFGGILLAAALLAQAAIRRGAAPGGPAGAWLAAAGGAAYLVGVLAVTAQFNVPLNRELAMLDPGGAGAVDAMGAYLTSWTAWNHVRTGAALIAAVLLAGSLACVRSRRHLGAVGEAIAPPRRSVPLHCLPGVAARK